MRGFLVACIITIVPVSSAAADPFEGLRLDGWYGKLGVESGMVFGRERGAAPLLGGVATFVHMNDRREWVGVQGDLLADGNGELATGARWSLGPEAGVSVVGVDVGYFGERLSGSTRHGLTGRLKLTVGLVALYARASYALRGADEASFDVGIQLKAPVFVRRPGGTPPMMVRR